MLQVAVLEDEQESRVQIKRCLERYQAENHAEWDMDYFSSGAELLFSGASGYDMLLMDIEMPQMTWRREMSLWMEKAGKSQSRL